MPDDATVLNDVLGISDTAVYVRKYIIIMLYVQWQASTHVTCGHVSHPRFSLHLESLFPLLSAHGGDRIELGPPLQCHGCRPLCAPCNATSASKRVQFGTQLCACGRHNIQWPNVVSSKSASQTILKPIAFPEFPSISTPAHAQSALHRTVTIPCDLQRRHTLFSDSNEENQLQIVYCKLLLYDCSSYTSAMRGRTGQK